MPLIRGLVYLSFLPKVQLVPDQDHAYSLQSSSAVLFHLFDPTHQVLKCLLSCDVIHKYDAWEGGEKREASENHIPVSPHHEG